MTIGGAGDTGGVGGDDSSSGASGGRSFAYGSRSLDELRSLAGSVDTARVADAQSDFARIAAQMDDVVSQLVAIQSHIPSWWHGATADQAIAKFGQVINHAQTAYTIADGAGRALSTCTTVIAEQQAAMAAVPELSKPRSGLEAGETFTGGANLAQESAFLAEEWRYEAARRRAVEVVNGMAAQFVETTAQLQNLRPSGMDNDFRVASEGTPSPDPVVSSGLPRAGSLPSQQPPRGPHRVSIKKDLARASKIRETPHLESPIEPSSRKPTRTTNATSNAYSTERDSDPASTQRSPKTKEAQSQPSTTAPQSEVDTYKVKAQTVYRDNIDASPTETSLSRIASRRVPPSSEKQEEVSSASQRRDSHHSAPDYSAYNPASPAVTMPFMNERSTPSLADTNLRSDSQLSTMSALPPLHDIGLGPHRYTNRSKRPAYLSEPKSTWLNDVPIAPFGGIITSEWDENSWD